MTISSTTHVCADRFSKRRSVGKHLLRAACIGLFSTAAAGAQGASSWHLSITPYFWLPGVDGNVGVNRVNTNVDFSQGDVSNNLRFALDGTLDARKKMYVIGVDMAYLSMGDLGDRTLIYSQKRMMTQPFGGVTIGGDRWAIDFIGGARIWQMHQMIAQVDPRVAPNQAASRSWADATGGARLFWLPLDFLRVNAGGDGGAGASHSTWQAYGTVGLDVTSWCTLGLTYRGMSVNYDRDAFLYDANMQGLAYSIGFRF